MPSTELTDKDLALQVIHDLPDDSRLEQIIQELAMHRMIQRGMADSLAGRTISHEEMKKRIESWRK